MVKNSPLELTKAELATLRCVAKRISIEDIAAASNVKVETIKLRLKIIREKLRLTSKEKNMLAAEASSAAS